MGFWIVLRCWCSLKIWVEAGVVYVDTVPFLDIIHRRMCVIGQDDVEMNDRSNANVVQNYVCHFLEELRKGWRWPAGIVTKIRAVNSTSTSYLRCRFSWHVLCVQLTKYVPSIVHVASFIAVESNNGTWTGCSNTSVSVFCFFGMCLGAVFRALTCM